MQPRGLICIVLALLLITQRVVADEVPQYILTAVAEPTRPAIDRERDVNRKPAEVIAFAGIKPGDKVADFMPGKGYFTRLLCQVVGDTGHVYAISVPFNRPAGQAPANGAALNAPAEPLSPVCDNITALTLKQQLHAAPEKWSGSDDPGYVYEYYTASAPAENFVAPEPLDVIWTAENYHDLHNKPFGSPDLQVVNAALFKALKSGGILLIEDHAAARGSGARDTATLHRIDPELVKKEVLAAGFELVATSKLLYHADDPHTLKAHEMHDRTDRFLLKFRKP